MFNNNYISNLLNLKDPNINFTEIKEENRKGIGTKVITGILVNKPDICPHCRGVHINIHGYKMTRIKLPKVSEYNAILDLKKQRYKCMGCGKTFTAKTSIVEENCCISNNTKHAAIIHATEKISEKDIAKRLNISHNTVNRIINSHNISYHVNFNYLPKALCFDEFKSTKDADGAMSFIYCDAVTHNIIDIIENRQLGFLKQYFYRFSLKVRKNVKYIVMDMYSPYISLVKECFPNAEIIMDKFHVINNFARALNKTRIRLMNSNKKLYNKLKNYYKLLLKDRRKVDSMHYAKRKCFNKWMSLRDIVDYLLAQDEELKNTYELYQSLLFAIKTKNEDLLNNILMSEHKNVSDYMKTAIRTAKKHSEYIINMVKYSYNNGVIEGINNKIKVIKRIAFGYRSFYHFRNRILIMFNLIHIEKVA